MKSKIILPFIIILIILVAVILYVVLVKGSNEIFYNAHLVLRRIIK